MFLLNNAIYFILTISLSSVPSFRCDDTYDTVLYNKYALQL